MVLESDESPDSDRRHQRHTGPAFGRRQFHALIMGAAVGGLLSAALSTGAFASAGAVAPRRWLRRLHALCAALEAEELSPTGWLAGIEALHREVELAELLRFIDFETLIAGVEYPDDRGAIRPVRLPRVRGLPRRLGFSAKIFAYKQGTATAPHGHNGMVSAHLVLAGEFRVRTFNRLFPGDEPDHLLLTGARDEPARPGDTVTMSDERDNVHWMEATSAHAYTLDVPITGVYENKRYIAPANRHGMIYVDPTGPENGQGEIRAPIMAFADAMKKFGGGSNHRGGR